MTPQERKVMELALEALESCDEGDWSTGHVIHPSYDEDAVKQAMIAIEEALAQPEQEPVALDWNQKMRAIKAMLQYTDGELECIGEKLLDTYCEEVERVYKALYTTPPQQSAIARTAAEGEDTRRAWVGLTESDRRLINFQWQDGNGTATEIIDLVEAKLKEKNT